MGGVTHSAHWPWNKCLRLSRFLLLTSQRKIKTGARRRTQKSVCHSKTSRTFEQYILTRIIFFISRNRGLDCKTIIRIIYCVISYVPSQAMYWKSIYQQHSNIKHKSDTCRTSLFSGTLWNWWKLECRENLTWTEAKKWDWDNLAWSKLALY